MIQTKAELIENILGHKENTVSEKELNKRSKKDLFWYWTELLNVGDSTPEQHKAVITSYQNKGGILDKYLEAHNITRYRLAKESGISQTTWFNANKQSLDHLTVKQVRAIAACTGVTASTALRKLEEIEK